LIKDLSDCAIFFINPDDRIASWNSAVECILGYSETEFLGEPFSILFAPEDQRVGIPQCELALAEQNGSTSDERWHIRKNGERFFVSGRVIAACSESGGWPVLLRSCGIKRPAGKRSSGG
jgi:PAS domain S-box-containing protein